MNPGLGRINHVIRHRSGSGLMEAINAVVRAHLILSDLAVPK